MITKVDKEKQTAIKLLHRRANTLPVTEDLMAFRELDDLVCEVGVPNGRNPRYVQSSYLLAARKMSFKISTRIIEGHVYLIKEDPDNEF